MQMGQKVMYAPHLVHMHWCPQSKQTVFVALRNKERRRHESANGVVREV